MGNLYLNENKNKTKSWFQARGNVVPLGGRRFGPIRSITFIEEKSNTSKDVNMKLSVQDDDYLAAVESGDTETARKMVEEAAEKAGYAGGEISPDRNEVQRIQQQQSGSGSQRFRNAKRIFLQNERP